MDKFSVAGLAQHDQNKKLLITLPSAKHVKIRAVKNGEENLHTDALIAEAVMNKKKLRTHHIYPITRVDGDVLHIPRTLQHILTSHPFPFSQGPINLPLDCGMEDKKSQWDVMYSRSTFAHSDSQDCGEDKKSPTEVIYSRTIFTHDNSQECGEWCPVNGRGWGEVGGGGADGEVEEIYLVHNLQFSVQGAASTRDNMGIVYTCQLLKCVINCPCGLCTDKRHNCKRLCKVEVCTKRNSQCTQHEMKVPRFCLILKLIITPW